MSRTNDPPFDDGWLPAAPHALGGTGGLRRSLERWAAEAAVDEAARLRTRERWLRIQSEEGATLAGVVIDLAEQGRPVSFDAAGHRHHGLVVGVGADFVAVRTVQDQDVLIPMAALTIVRAHPDLAGTVGDRPPLLDIGFTSVLGPLAAERSTVLVRTTDGIMVRGRLHSAGIDIMHVRADGDPPLPTWIAIAAVGSLTIEP